jgi:hypothetical protein
LRNSSSRPAFLALILASQATVLLENFVPASVLIPLFFFSMLLDHASQSPALRRLLV